jgi:sortase A
MKFRTKGQMFLPTRTQSFLHWSRYPFFIFGILALGYAGFALLDARLYQAHQTWKFQQALLKSLRPSIGNGEHPHFVPLPTALVEANHVRTESPDTTGRGRSPWGRIEISTIGLAAMILEGIEEKTLRRAVGHFPGTALPGQPGNVALAGHRDTFFRALHNIRKDDEITLETLDGSYRYRVDSTKVVDPEDTEVLDHSDDAILTLVTCYPFAFVGSAPKRFVVRAHRIPE